MRCWPCCWAWGRHISRKTSAISCPMLRATATKRRCMRRPTPAIALRWCSAGHLPTVWWPPSMLSPRGWHRPTRAILAAHVTGSVDLARMERTTAAAYAHVPAFLLPADVRRMERAVRAPDAVGQGMERLYTALLMPTGDLAEQTFARDPLQLFAPVGTALQQGGDGQRFSLYDDHIFTPRRTACAGAGGECGGAQ